MDNFAPWRDAPVIMHLDMNAFFASVEQAAKPELRGRPIAVIGSGARTVLTTASYEARAFGVKTGMNVPEAKALCPELVLVVGDNERYCAVSTAIMELLHDFSPIVEVFSIDEAFVDLTGMFCLFPSIEALVAQAKAAILQRFGLTCSVGVAPNKLLAKLASDLIKPDGLVIVRPEHVAALMARTPVKDLCGVGPATQAFLARYGVTTCAELAAFPVEVLTRKFGVLGPRLQLMGQGLDPAPVVASADAPPARSVGHSTTFEKDLSDRQELQAALLQLAEMVCCRARRHGLVGRTVALTVRLADFTTFTRQLTLPEATAVTPPVYRAACELLSGVALEQPVRLLGVRLAALGELPAQLALFAPETSRPEALAGAMDAINAKFGTGKVTYAPLLGTPQRSRIISPSWRPDGVRRVDVGNDDPASPSQPKP